MRQGFKEAISEGPTVLYNISKSFLGAPAQAWQQYSMQGRMKIDREQPQEKEKS